MILLEIVSTSARWLGFAVVLLVVSAAIGVGVSLGVLAVDKYSGGKLSRSSAPAPLNVDGVKRLDTTIEEPVLVAPTLKDDEENDDQLVRFRYL